MNPSTQDSQPLLSASRRRRKATLAAYVTASPVPAIQPENMPPLASARYVRPVLAHLLTGYTVKAMQRKIERGDWVKGKVWTHAPDGLILIDMVGYQKWVEGL